MTEILDTLDLGPHHRLAVVTENNTLSAVPMALDGDGVLQRAHPGDGAAEALLDLIAEVTVSRRTGRFAVRSWTDLTAVGEQAIGVDQTNESVIVGATAVVKWATHLQQGPHPAMARINALRDAGFTGMPAPWGLVTWQPPGAAETLVAYADEFLPGAVDGWTWAVDIVTAASAHRDSEYLAAAIAEVGTLVAELHAALAPTASLASERDTTRWRDDALELLETACEIGDSASCRLLRSARAQIVTELETLGTLAGTAVLEGHGDLHVGQVLHGAGRFVVTDFDGNPVLPASQRALPIPAVLDVAGMIQSLAHVAIVASKYTSLDPGDLGKVDRHAREVFLAAYRRRLAELGHARLYDPRPLRAFRIQQVIREMIYAANHLDRWMYVPDAALPALLDERTEL
ncbi:hypothetical protein GCM10027535_26400 [Mycolicibacterium hippocampi]|uniref:Glucosamine kinase n=1 Tax=Mycolicibacterium hippocampi TaxID=659824 RepID=A0A7I9ZSD3_9MYCO|nr:hypothetical protein MHIP_40610 [Mycolicibacterium hippocampi]